MSVPAPTPRRLVFALAPGVLLAGVAGGMAFPILPSVGMRVGLPLAFIGFVLAANRITRVVVSPVVGLVTDRFGGRRTLVVGLLLQVLVMGLFALGVTTPYAGPFFLAGRIVHGFGSSCVFVAAQSLALHGGDASHSEGRGPTGPSAAVRAAMQVGVPIGLVSSGLLADFCGEAATFAIGGFALLVAAIVAIAFVPDLRVERQRGASLRAALRLFLDLRLAAVGALGFASAFAGSGMVLTTTTILVHSRHFSIWSLPERATASVLMGWLVITEALAMPWLGRLGDRRRAHAAVAASGLLLTIPALVWLAWSERVGTVAVGLAVLGVAVAALGPSLLALLGERVPPARRGLGVGALQVATDAGGALGPLLGSALVTGSLSTPYVVTAGVSALLLPFAWILVRADRGARD